MSGKSFLIVDDDQDDCELFCDAVYTINSTSTCMVAKNGEDALILLTKKGVKLPDLIFLDLNMPLMNGMQCLAELKKNPKLKNIPVIIYSTSSNQLDIDESMKLGAGSYLTKPSDFNILCKEITTMVKYTFSTQAA